MAKGGRKGFIVNEETLKKIEGLALTGMTHEGIASCCGISHTTLYTKIKQYPDIKERINLGRQKGAAVVGGKLVELAREGNLGAIIWYEKTRCGRSDKIDVNSNTTITHKHTGISRSVGLLEEYQAGRGEIEPDADSLPN